MGDALGSVLENWNSTLTVVTAVGAAIGTFVFRRRALRLGEKVEEANRDAADALKQANKAHQQSADALQRLADIGAAREAQAATAATEAAQRAEHERKAAKLSFRMEGTERGYVEGMDARWSFRLVVTNEGQHSASSVAIEVLSCYRPEQGFRPAQPLRPGDLRLEFNIPSGRSTAIDFGSADDQEPGNVTFDIYEVRASWSDGNGHHTERFRLPPPRG